MNFHVFNLYIFYKPSGKGVPSGRPQLGKKKTEEEAEEVKVYITLIEVKFGLL